MTTRLFLALILVLAVAAPGPADPPRQRPGGHPALTLARNGPRTVPNQLVVRFRPGVRPQAAAALHRRAGARTLGGIPQLQIQRVQVPALAAARVYQRSPDVLWVEANARRYPLVAAPNDPAYNDFDYNLPLFPEDATWYEWDAHLIETVAAYTRWPNHYYTSTGKGAEGVRVAVIDTGIDYTHPDFANAGGSNTDVVNGGNLERALDRTFLFGGDEDEAPDEYGHGTHVAGVIAAATNNARGVTANAPNATIVSVKVLDAAGAGDETDLARGIVYAADAGALVCNISLGGYVYSQAEQDAVNYAWDQGMLVIAASGNDGTNVSPNYPAALSRVLAVGATSRMDVLATYSNFGDYVGIAAPGGDFDFQINWFLGVYSTMPTYFVTLNDPDVYGAQTDYDYLMGTSFAAPQAAGLAALYAGMKGYTQQTPNVTTRLWQALQRGCENVSGGAGNWDPYYGFGRINMPATMNLDTAPNPRGATAGCIVGQIRYRGTPVANAQIAAVPVGGGVTVQASSRADGGYRITNAPPGVYDVRATVFGESNEVDGVQVIAGCDAPGVDINVGTGGPPDPNAPPAPGNLTATAVSASAIDLAWSDVNGETGYRIERSPNGVNSWSLINSTGANITTFPDTGLAGGTSYYYRAYAFNDVGPSPYSNIASATTALGTPTGVAAIAVSTSEIDVSWNDLAGEEGYRVDRSANGVDGWGQVGTTGANVTLFQNVGLPPGTTFFYRVYAHNSGGVSPFSVVVSATTQSNGPSGLTATAVSSTAIDVAWNDLSDEQGYRLERSPNGVNTWTLVADLAANATSYSNSDLTPGTGYYYRVYGYVGPTNGPYSAVVSESTYRLTIVYASADAHVRKDKPTKNYGSLEALSVMKKRPKEFQTFLKFDLTGIGTVRAAVFNIYCTEGSPNGGALKTVGTTKWMETTINWRNRPPAGAVIGEFGPAVAASWETVVVASQVSGNGSVSFAITSPDKDMATYRSRDGAGQEFHPYLRIEHE